MNHFFYITRINVLLKEITLISLAEIFFGQEYVVSWSVYAKSYLFYVRMNFLEG